MASPRQGPFQGHWESDSPMAPRGGWASLPRPQPKPPASWPPAMRQLILSQVSWDSWRGLKQPRPTRASTSTTPGWLSVTFLINTGATYSHSSISIAGVNRLISAPRGKNPILPCCLGRHFSAHSFLLPSHCPTPILAGDILQIPHHYDPSNNTTLPAKNPRAPSAPSK